MKNTTDGYAITLQHDGQRRVMVITEDDGTELARYALGVNELADCRATHRAIRLHLRTPGATLHNYQW